MLRAEGRRRPERSAFRLRGHESDVLVEARQETTYYAAYAEAFQPVQFMVYVMTGMLVLGGTFVGPNTLFAAVMSRIREIGVLRSESAIAAGT